MDPHPYRLAMSCLDTPPSPLDPPRRRHIPIEALMLACAAIAAGTGLATLHAVGHGGHVEIGPAALAHLKKKPKPVETKPRPHVERPTSVAQMPLLLEGSHEPKTLLATAKQLQTLGLDVTVVEVQLPKRLSPAGFFPASTLSVRDRYGNIDGVELHGVPPDSPIRAAGLADGDQLLGINGYTFVDDTIGQATLLMNGKSLGWTIVEIARGNHHVVLSIRWQVP
jgi:hypothetical protein